jgi:hypothetical protein
MRRSRRSNDVGEHHHAYSLCRGILCLYRGTEVVQVSVLTSIELCVVPHILAVLLAIAANPRGSTRRYLEGVQGDFLIA